MESPASLAGTDQQNQWLHLVLVGSRRGLSKQMQQASSMHTALGSTAVLTFPTDSGISYNRPAGVDCTRKLTQLSCVSSMAVYAAP